MRISTTHNYHLDYYTCGVEACKRLYCPTHRLLYNWCDTASRDYENDMLVYSDGDCPKCTSDSTIRKFRALPLPLILIALLVSGCSKDKDKTEPQRPSSPGPVPITCSTHVQSSNGGIGGPEGVMEIYFPVEPDSWSGSYKRWNATEWSIYRPGFYSTVTFTLTGSTLTIRNETPSIQHDWAYTGSYTLCH